MQNTDIFNTLILRLCLNATPCPVHLFTFLLLLTNMRISLHPWTLQLFQERFFPLSGSENLIPYLRGVKIQEQ